VGRGSGSARKLVYPHLRKNSVNINIYTVDLIYGQFKASNCDVVYPKKKRDGFHQALRLRKFSSQETVLSSTLQEEECTPI
jgi:hypothetical protein